MRYDEIKKLAKILSENLISFELSELHGGYQIKCEDWDAICHDFSYGGKEGLLETYGAIVDEDEVGDTVEGFLTAEDVLDRYVKMTEKKIKMYKELLDN